MLPLAPVQAPSGHLACLFEAFRGPAGCWQLAVVGGVGLLGGRQCRRAASRQLPPLLPLGTPGNQAAMPDTSWIQDLTVAKLKDELKKRGQPVQARAGCTCVSWSVFMMLHSQLRFPSHI